MSAVLCQWFLVENILYNTYLLGARGGAVG